MWKLAERRTAWRLTWPGRILAAGLLAGALRLSAPGAYRFLAVTDDPAGDYLVVEGWIPDDRLEAVARLAADGGYRAVICTGIPIDTGRLLSGFETWAHAGAERLIGAGVPPERVLIAPAANAGRNRTYASARALRDALAERSALPARVDLATAAPHARRSRLLFATALGPGSRVGVLPVEHDLFDARSWWKSSDGFQTVVSELIAYAYARLWLLAGRPGGPRPPEATGSLRPRAATARR